MSAALSAISAVGSSFTSAEQGADPVALRGVVPGGLGEAGVPARVRGLEVEGAARRHVGDAGEERERVEAQAALAAEHLAGLLAVVVHGPGLLDVERDAAVQAHPAEAHLLDAVVAELAPVLVHVQLLVRRAGHRLHAGVADQVEDLGEVVDAHVEERPARRDAAVDEVGRAVAVDEGPAAPAVAERAGVVDPAEVALVDEPLGGVRLGLVDRGHLDVEHAAGLARRGHHALGVAEGAGHRLLAVDVLAALEHRDRDRRVLVVVHAHVDRVEVVAREQLLVVAVGVGDAEPLARAASSFSGKRSAAATTWASGISRVVVEMVGADLADADDADANLVLHHSSPAAL